jgi:hypothetical protein
MAIQALCWPIGQVYRKHSFLYCCLSDRVYRAVTWQLQLQGLHYATVFRLLFLPPLRSRYSRQHSLPRHFQSTICYSRNLRDQCSHPHRTSEKITAVHIFTYPGFAWLIARVSDFMIESIGPLYNWLQQFTNHYRTYSHLLRLDTARERFWLPTDVRCIPLYSFVLLRTPSI